MNPCRPTFRLILIVFLMIPSLANAADWTQWRGPDRTGLSKETGLVQEWPEKGPAVVWAVDYLGQGYSSLAVRGDQLFTQGNIDGKGQVPQLRFTARFDTAAPAEVLMGARYTLNRRKGSP